jgi:hypothetical protein
MQMPMVYASAVQGRQHVLEDFLLPSLRKSSGAQIPEEAFSQIANLRRHAFKITHALLDTRQIGVQSASLS